mgnify:CR=1 FL=1
MSCVWPFHPGPSPHGLWRLRFGGESSDEGVGRQKSSHDRLNCNAVRKLEKKFEGLELHHIPRLKNQAADDLAKIGSKREAIPSNVFLEHIHTPSVQEDPFTEEAPQPKSAMGLTEVEVPAVVDLVMEVLVITPDWTVTYIAYILRKELRENEEEARQIVRRSKAFTVIKGQLYRESATGVGQKCITPEEG